MELNTYKEGSNLRNLANALSNVKRALDCQVETIIFDYAYFTKSKKERWNFPKKLDFIKDQGIIAPRILKKINSIRNLLEHEFKKPSLEEVEDALDIVTLFIGYVDKLSKIPNRIMLYRRINGPKVKSLRYYYSLEFDKERSEFTVIDTKDRKLFKITEQDKSFDLILDQLKRFFQ